MLIHTFFKNADTATRIFLTIIENLAVYLIILKLGLKWLFGVLRRGIIFFHKNLLMKNAKVINFSL